MQLGVAKLRCSFSLFVWAASIPVDHAVPVGSMVFPCSLEAAIVVCIAPLPCVTPHHVVPVGSMVVLCNLESQSYVALLHLLAALSVMPFARLVRIWYGYGTM